MRKTVITIVALFIYSAGFSQNEAAKGAPYTRFRSMPPFKLLLTDSSTHFTKDDIARKTSVVLMLFSPDCEHCQHEMELIIQNIDAFGKTQFILSTTREFDDMLRFYEQYDLGRFSNIIVGKDVGYLLPVFFDVRNLPFLAFYDKKKELVSVFEGAMPIEKMIAETKK